MSLAQRAEAGRGRPPRRRCCFLLNSPRSPDGGGGGDYNTNREQKRPTTLFSRGRRPPMILRGRSGRAAARMPAEPGQDAQDHRQRNLLPA